MGRVWQWASKAILDSESATKTDEKQGRGVWDCYRKKKMKCRRERGARLV